MPIIPIPEGLRRVARDSFDESEAERYRAEADAKLKALQTTPMAQLGPDEPLKGDFKRPAWMGSRGYDTPDFTSSAEPTIVPAEGDQSRDLSELGLSPRFSEDLSQPAAPESDVPGVGFGSGGPEGGALSEATILDIRQRLADKQASTSADKDMRSRLLQGVNPDEAASAIDLAAKSGVNRLQVEVNPETYKRADTMRQIDQLRTTAPKLRAWLDYNPENLDVSYDDVDNLSWWETAGRMAYNTPGALWASVVGSGESTLGVTQMSVDAADEMARSPSPALAAIFGNSKEATRIARDLNARAVGGTLPQDPNSPLAMASKALNAPRMSLREYKNAVTPKGSSDLESGYYSGIVSLGQNAPLIIATALTKNAAFMTVGMTASTAGEAYSRATDEHPELSYSQRAAYALTQAGIEFITEVGPNALFVEALLKGSIKDQIVGFGMQQVSEQLGEQAATALQDLNDWLTLKPEATWEDYLKERPSAALQTFVATMVAGGGQVAIGKAADAAGQKIDAQNQQKRAEDLAGFVRALGDNAKDSKLLKRMPEKWREAVAHVNKDGPKENVLISPVGIEELAQTVGVKPEQLAAALRIDPAKMAADMDAGEYVSVPIGDYAAMIQTAKKDVGVSGEQIYAALEQHIKFDDKEMTGAERKVLREEFDKAMTLEADMEAGTDFADKAARVLNDARSRINALGRYNADTSATESLVVAKLIINVAQRENLDPEVLWNQYASQYNNVVGGSPTTGELPQSYRRPAEPIGDNELEYAAVDLTPLEFEAWKGAREGLSNEEITDRINEAEPDAVYTTDKIKEAISRARGRGFDSQSSQTSFYNRGKDAKTLRLIDLRAKGVKNAQIAEALYPDVPTDAALNRVKALASKNKAKIEERAAELAAKAGQKELAQTKAAGFSGMNLFEKNIINLYSKAQLDSLVHEHAHFYLKVLEHMNRTSETPLPFVVSQLAAIRSAFGKNQEFDIYDANGQITAEGIEVQELFAESFGVWFMTGKAPSAEMRSMFATIKQWMLDLYKAVKNGIRNAIINDGNPYLKNRIAAAEGRRGKSFTNEELVEFVIPEELREVFDRALASDEAIEAASKKITIDATKLAQAMLDKKVITQRQFEKAKERLLAAKLQAQDEMRARMIDEYIRSKRAPWREEERELEKDFFSEVDERANQRHYQVMSGEGWRDTLEDHVADLAAQAQVMENAQQAGYKGMNLEEAADWIAAREKGLDLTAEVRHERAKEQGFTARFWHETQTGTQVITSGFDLSKRLASTGDHIMPIGVFMKPGKGGIGIGGDQLELLVRLGNTQTFADRTELEAHLRQDAEYAKLADEVASIDASANARYEALDASWKQTKEGSPEYYALNAQLRQAALERDEAIAVAAEAARVRATAVFKEQGVNSLTIGKDTGSATRPVKTTIVLDTRDIRSVDAAFDPDNAQRSGMLAQLAGERGRTFSLAHSGGSKQPLPMDEASRMGRRKAWQAEKGPVDDKTWFHSDSQGFEAVDPTKGELGLHVGDKFAADLISHRTKRARRWSSKDGNVAEPNMHEMFVRGNFASAPDLHNFASPLRYLEARMSPSKAAEFDSRYDKMWKQLDEQAREIYSRNGDDPAAWKSWRDAVHTSARDNKISGWEYANQYEAGVSRVIFDPTAARRTDATFDPAQSGSSKLLAHTGQSAAAISDAYADSLQYTVMNATDESLAGLRQQMINDGVVPVILLFKSTTGRIIAFPGGSEAAGLHHDQAREVLGLGDLKLQHGVYNPRKWSSLSDMAGPGAWYDTTGVAIDTGSELAQSKTNAPKGERELDALGFYSAVQEAAQRVPDNIWNMGWQAVRNALAKGRDGIAPKRTEIEYLGLDAMFGDTKLKGADLKAAVLEHIAAKRLSLKEDFVRYDPQEALKPPSKAKILETIGNDVLADMIGVNETSMGEGRGRVFASELDGANEFFTGLFIQLNKELTSESVRVYDLMRVLDGGKSEMIDSGVIGELRGVAARTIVDSNQSLVMRKISAEAMGEYWQNERMDTSEGRLVRGAGNIRLPGEHVPLFEAVIGFPEGVPGSDYQAPRSHVGGKAKGTLVTIHGEERVDDKGQRTLFAGQVQSDMAQQAREQKEIDKQNAAVIEKSGITDLKSALDYLETLSMGYTREQIDAQYLGVPDTKVIAKARSAWANRNDMHYSDGAWDDGLATDAPLLSTSEWTNVAVRSMIYRAAREGFPSISFTTAETSEIIQGNDDAAQHYETNVKGALEKIGKQLGGEVRKGSVRYNPLDQSEWENLPPDTAEAVLQSMWSRLPPAVRGTIRMNMANMRKTDDGEFYVATASRPGNDDSGVGKDTYEWTFAREAKRNPLIAAYNIWVQGAMIFNQPGAFERLITAAGGPKGAITEALEQAIAEGEPATAYVLDITPEMRAKIIAEGFSLFHTRTSKGRTAQPAAIPAMRLNLNAVREQHGDAAVAALPPKVRAYSTNATDADDFLREGRAALKTANKPRPKSLWKYLSTSRVIGSGNDKISYRGIRDDGGELIKIIGEKKAAPGLISDKEDAKKVRSYTIEQAAQAAWEAGYFNGESPPTPTEFLDALRADIDGQAKLYAADDMEKVAQIDSAQQWVDWFDENEIDLNEKNDALLQAQIAVRLSGTNENAVGPDEAAQIFNAHFKKQVFKDGKDFLDSLQEGTKRNQIVRDLVKAEMIKRHGDIFNDGTVMQEAEAYARNQILERQDEIELEALANAVGQQASANMTREMAKERLREKQVREVLNYHQWLTLEQRWMAKAVKAAEEGNMAKALEFKRIAMINRAMYSEGKKLAEKIEATRKTLVAYGTKPRQKRLFAAGKEYAENMNSLLDDYQLRNETKAGEDKRVQRAAWIKAQLATIDPFASYQDTTKSAQEQQVEAAEAIERSRALANEQPSEAKGYKSLTVEEFMAVDAEASMIWKMATLADQRLKEGKRRRLTLAAEDVAAEIIANQPKEKPPEPIESDAPGEKVKRGVLKYFAMHRTMQSLANQFAGGKDGGEFWSYFVKPLNAAFAHLSTLRKQMGEDLTKLFGAYSSQEIARFYKDRQTFNLSSGSVALTTQGRLAVALNVGNEKNRQRLMDSMGWTLADIQTITDTLTKRDWDFVQATWDYLNTWFPEANRVHEAVHGAPMDKVEPLQVATRFGVYAGGYYPIAFDPELSSKSAQRKTEADAKSISGRVDARSAPSFSKKRVEGKVTLPLKLSVFDVITRHLDQVATSIATEEVLFDAGRLIRRPEVEDAIVKHHGRQIYNSIVNILVTTKFGMEGTSGILAHLRNGATVVGLGWKVATALLQPLGVSNSVVRVGGYWVAKGYARMGRDAATIQSSAKWVMERSEFMRHRRQSQSPELAALKDSIKKGGLTPRWLTQSMFALMSNTQFYSVDLPTWYAGWYKAKATGLDDAEAAAQGDQAVIDAQGGGELHQTAAIQTGAGTKYAAALRLLTNFMGYMVTTYNLATQRARNADTVAKMAALAFDMVILLAIPVAGKMALDAWTKGGGDDDDELWEKYGREQAAFLMSPFVGISQVAGSMRGDDAFSYRGPAGLGIFAEATNAGKAAAELDFDQSFWRPANKVAGMMLHYPASQADLTFRGALALWNGETTNPAAIFFGPAPAN